MFVRNWILPIAFAGIGALLGAIAFGLPGVNLVQTIDGSPVAGGVIPPEQVSVIIDQGKRTGSYLDFYGLHLPGQPWYWAIGIIGAMTFLGYRAGCCFAFNRQTPTAIISIR
ncbi:hypothetical protein LAC81_34525 (plasmid) [Ensifer adhaerens]|uniref:hypothetical protein n=1 Tax=Ensifer adhaerens TaxID=106592 RepID=UPI001CBADCFE|nr:hypothetical protein [Ensifer adhaerens]MBZ7927075.1 hypothetical protein [Ensifer adhaerens]UAX98122.1 hypothetical protein LAC78_35825 [Ensifer adhaerens]UAY12881.1 hypothetical protein LAC81_34525 [Ensifer adhaerens]